MAGTLALAAALLQSEAAGQRPPANTETPQTSSIPGTQAALSFDISGTKFAVESLMSLLKDRQHEGWVLAAYPDPKTSRPLIGAGFSLDVEASEHVQSDPLNPHQFLEPSSAQLWQAAGLDPGRLQKVLEQFDDNLSKWNRKNYRKKIKANRLPPQITDAEGLRLLRASALQATHNAKAYCREYDQLTAPQQMALSELVYQMGVNLEQFTQFLAVLNNDPLLQNVLLLEGGDGGQVERWKVVQQTLIESQWARHYTTRAVTVIAMFDPAYERDPTGAERRIQAVLRPPAKHSRKKTRAKPARAANTSGGGHKSRPSA